MGVACTSEVSWGKGAFPLDKWVLWKVTRLGSFERYLPKKTAYGGAYARRENLEEVKELETASSLLKRNPQRTHRNTP